MRHAAAPRRTTIHKEDRSMDDRVEQLRAEVARLEARVAHLAEQAKVCEHGRLIAKTRTKDGEVTEEESLQWQPSPAVAYWKEIRETEKRLDDKHAELDALERTGAGQPVHVVVHFDGPQE
jgi:predicted RNase H-like nuclease (RuvC/YqgF family)